MENYLVMYYDLEDDLATIQKVFDGVVKQLGNEIKMPVIAIPNTVSINKMSREQIYKYWEEVGLTIGSLVKTKTESADAPEEKNDEKKEVKED